MKYLIKKTYTATENNPNFAGKTETWFCGRGSAFSGKKGDITSIEEVPIYYIKEHAYHTRAAATRALIAIEKLKEEEEKRGFWNINLEVVEV